MNLNYTNKIFLLSIILVLLFSCKHDLVVKNQKRLSEENFARRDTILDSEKAFSNHIIRNNVVAISCDLTKAEKKLLYLANCVEDYKLIKLETTDDNYIGSLDEVIIAGDRIFCVDSWSSMAIFIFDMEGRYLDKISALGKGPGEYLAITQVAVDTINSIITVYDQKSKRLLKYGFDSEFQGAEKTNAVFDQFYFTDSTMYYFNRKNGNYHLSNGQLNHLLCCDKKGKLKWYGHPFATDLFHFTYGGAWNAAFQNYGSELLYLPVLSDTVYSIRGNCIQAKYYFDFKGDGLDKYKPFTRKFYAYFTEESDRRKYQTIGRILETDSVLFFNPMIGSKHFYGIYDKNTGISHVGFAMPFNDTKAPIWDQPRWCYGNYFVGSEYAFNILDDFKRKEKICDVSKLNRQYLDLVANLKEDDNPVIFLCKFNNLHILNQE